MDRVYFSLENSDIDIAQCNRIFSTGFLYIDIF